MKLYDINPFLRFASQMRYDLNYDQKLVLVTDCRIFYVLDGTLTIQCSGNLYKLSSGDLFYFNAGSQYTVTAPEGTSLFCLNFDLTQAHREFALPIAPTWQRSQWKTTPVFSDKIENSHFLGSHLHLKNAVYLYDQIEKIITDYISSTVLGQELSSARLKLLLIQLHCTTNHDIPDSILRVKAYIEKNYSQNITNKTLAALVGYHEYYLNRLFVKYTGMSLHNYLVKYRLTQANHLILNTNLPLQDIAAKTGFNNYSSFFVCHKKHYGYTPLEYRKLFGGG